MGIRSLSALLAGALALSSVAATLSLAPAVAKGPKQRSGPEQVRFATFNASLNRGAEGALVADLSSAGNAQAGAVAEIVQRTRPDVLLLNEFDYVPDNEAIDLFRKNYLEIPQHEDVDPVEYPYAFVAPSNTGIPSGHDLDNSGGEPGGPNDAFGFGEFPGQYGMAVLSKYPIAYDDVRTFQHFLWADMPGAHLPDDPATPEPADWYSPEELAVFRLSSKSHWDVPIRIGRRTVHFLVSHPTPPVFDGVEDRNGLRNFDEIGFWADYVGSRPRSSYIYDDEGQHGGLKPGSRFVIAGDQNSDPLDGDSVPGAIQQLLDHPRVNTSRVPESEGAVEAAAQGGNNEGHLTPDKYDTADFGDFGPFGPGNLRVDYVLPSKQLRITDSGVFWPVEADPLSRLVDMGDSDTPPATSDHRLVWVDVRVP